MMLHSLFISPHANANVKSSSDVSTILILDNDESATWNYAFGRSRSAP